MAVKLWEWSGSADVSLTPEDEALFDSAADECKRLSLEKLSPTALVWTGGFPSDQCLLDRGLLLLPHGMKGKLQPGEWRPLMASAILQRRKYPRRSQLLRDFVLLLSLAVVGVIVVGVGTITILRAVGIDEATIRSASMASVFGLLGVVAILRGLTRPRYLKRLRLRADSEAVRSPGGEGLLQVLSKIDSLHLAEIERLNAAGFRARFHIWPSLSERIRNLQTPRA